MKTNKLQALLITQLQKQGSVKLLLPDGVTLEIGVNQIDSTGNLRKVDDYCWIMASREDKMAILDSFNVGVRYTDEKALIYSDEIITSDGEKVKQLDVI